MEYFTRGNSKATPRSVLLHAIGFGGGALLIYLVAMIWVPFLQRAAWPVLPITVILSAGIGALMEWQLDDPESSDDEAA